ncbi:MAG: hypothetical protein OQL05_04725 [Gammaproteobacteria bacterium]|nr:hypothetical protein [Gammaproteobacteria bacterium]MCW8958860.1 hypothetical protein [Gammaproteobacteria bacterium]MCW8972565.1 hypothetical protein [Gammaproteobacteria bacterium]MCW8993176.1 hypothetical protein [Gammaproteobacteria bacterium]
MRRWVAELPLGDTGEAARRLFTMLRETNRLSFPPAARAEMLQLITPAFDGVYAALARHYNGLTFPLPQKSVRTAELANHLLAEMVIAWKSVLTMSEQASWLFRLSHRLLWVLAVHHMIVYLGDILSNYRTIHRHAPAGVWNTLHQLYQQARQRGRVMKKVLRNDEMGQRSSIEQEYKRTLLLSLLEPQLFRRDQLGQVCATMDRWLDEAQLLPASACREDLVAYCIHDDLDAPHTLQTGQCDKLCDKSGSVLLLELGGVNRAIETTLARMGDESAIRLPGSDMPVSREALETLLQCWRVPQGEREARHASGKTVLAAVGMSANYSLLHRQDEEERAQGISDQEPTEEKSDAWESVFLDSEAGYRNWAKKRGEKDYHYLTAREANYTATGRCLVFDSREVESLQVSELIGLRESQGEPLQLYIVRWLQDNDETISVGLMRLAVEAEAVLVVLHQAEGRRERKLSFGCLLGIGDDHRVQLVVPYLPGFHDRSLYLLVDGKELPVTLGDKVFISPLFESWHVAVDELLLEPSSGEKIPLAEVNSRLRRMAHSDEEIKNLDRNDFSDLWESL